MGGPFAVGVRWVGGIESRLGGQDDVELFTATLDAGTGDQHRCLTGTSNRPGQRRITAILVDPKGRAVWVAIAQGAPEVGACESSGPRVLDSGDGIDPASVSLKGSTVTWSDSGAQRSAQLH
jgi:hypothetical protein